MLRTTSRQLKLARCDRTARDLDELIADRIEARIGSRIRNLSVNVADNTVRIHGECSTFYTKQLAQHAAMGVIEDEQVVNEIKVRVPA